jgi:RNA polymerase sigma-70 factor, ECF subfamily
LVTTQEAFAIAAERWPQDGVPANPGAWLVTTARNRAINRIRRDRTLAAKTRLLQVPPAEDTMDPRRFPTSGSSSSSPAASGLKPQ